MRARIRLRLPRPFPFRLLKDILRIGIPGTGDGLACNAGNIFLTYCVSTMGADALAAHTYAVQLIAFVQVLGYSVARPRRSWSATAAARTTSTAPTSSPSATPGSPWA